MREGVNERDQSYLFDSQNLGHDLVDLIDEKCLGWFGDYYPTN